ncbi:MAG: carbon-nitrogen family hydrolase [Nitrospirae bacterium]|nr:carbon-nitrogen family hydrolase [Nitrospirota bacterium]
MKVALIQLDSVWESKKENFEKAAVYTEKAAAEKCDVIVFPELFATGFSMNIQVVAENGYGETASFLSALARRNSINLIAGLAMKPPGDGRVRNMAVVFDRKGRPDATYTKMHSFPLSEETEKFVEGPGTVVFNIDAMPSSVFICYDLRFPELFRDVAPRVQAIFVIANWPSERKEQWETLLRARAIENQCFVIGVNRTGIDGNGIGYPGSSGIFGPAGNIICTGNATEEFISGKFDPYETDRLRDAFPFLKDMKQVRMAATYPTLS